MTTIATPRWIAPMVAEAAECAVALPWQRGARRAAVIARRQTAEETAEPRQTAAT